jgi:hypothetical protein
MPAALQPSPAAAHHNEARPKHVAKPSLDVLLGTDEQNKLITKVNNVSNYAFNIIQKPLEYCHSSKKIQIKIGLKRYNFLLERAKLYYDSWPHRYKFVILLFAFFQCFKLLAMFIFLLVYFNPFVRNS